MRFLSLFFPYFQYNTNCITKYEKRGIFMAKYIKPKVVRVTRGYQALGGHKV